MSSDTNNTTSTTTRRDSVTDGKKYLSNDDSERENSVGVKDTCWLLRFYGSTTPSTTANSSEGRLRQIVVVVVVVVGTFSSWDPEDDLLLRHLKEIKKLGWKEISRFFENRTPDVSICRRRLNLGTKVKKTALVDVTDYDEVLKALRFGKLNEYIRTAAAVPTPALHVPTTSGPPTTAREPAGSSLSPMNLSNGNSKVGTLQMASNPTTSGEVSPLGSPICSN